jgi:hypothetical protein
LAELRFSPIVECEFMIFSKSSGVTMPNYLL